MKKTRSKKSRDTVHLKLDGGMPKTDTKTTAVWGTPILLEIKLRAYRYRVFLHRKSDDRNLPQGDLSRSTFEV
jgi:hypothetical protein